MSSTCRWRLVSLATALLIAPVSTLVPWTPWFGRRHRLPSALSASIATEPTFTGGDERHQQRRRSTKQVVRHLFRRAQDLERKGQWRKSASVLREILVMDPLDAHSHLALARLEARRNPSSSAAVEAFRNGTEACPTSVHLWQAWAVYQDSMGDAEGARQLFQRALQIEPNNPYVCHAMGLMERRLSRTSSVPERLWQRALTKTSTAALVCSLGDLLISEGRLEEARKLYRRHATKVAGEREMMEVYLAWSWLEERYFEKADRAEQLIQKALACSPTSSVAQVALARLEGRRRMQQQGGQASSTATVRRLATTCISDHQSSSDGRVYNAWASIEVKARRFAKARKILQKGLDRFPTDHTLWQAAGRLEERMGNYTGARELYSTSLKVQPSAPTLVAYALLELRQPESGTCNVTKTIRLFEEALLLDPRHGPAYNAYARTVFQRTGDIEEARRVFGRGVKAHCPDAASIYHGYARLELTLGNVDRARELLLQGRQQAQRQDVGKDYPHRERALFLTHTLGMLELNRNHPADAKEVFLDGIQRYGNSSQLLLGAALCEINLGNEDKARALFERSVLSDEKHAQAWQAWGVMEMRAGNMNTAKTLFDCGIKSAPRHGALWQAYATMESRMNNVETARALFEKGVKHAPNHVPLYQSWAFMELREGNFPEAKALIAQALTRDKRNGAGWLIAAEIEEQMGNDGLATLLLRRGIECSPTKPELYRALGDSLVRRGKIDEAREVFEQGMKVDPRHAPLYHSLAELEARVFNLEGLSKLHKRTAAIFSTNALEPPETSSEIWGAKIRANRSKQVPRGVAALAQRIVEEDGNTEVVVEDADPSFFDKMSSTLLEEGWVGQLLTVDDDSSSSSNRETN